MVDVELSEVEKAMKTGCALEKRQLRDYYALSNATALALPIAWKLPLLKSKNLAHPDEPATQVLDADEREVLRHIACKLLSDAPSVHEVVYAIAAPGGHLRHNVARGWQTLAHGYERLHAVFEGHLLLLKIQVAGVQWRTSD